MLLIDYREINKNKTKLLKIIRFLIDIEQNDNKTTYVSQKRAQFLFSTHVHIVLEEE